MEIRFWCLLPLLIVISCATTYDGGHQTNSRSTYQSEIFTCVRYVDENEDGIANRKEFKDQRIMFYEDDQTFWLVIHAVNLKDNEGTRIIRNADGQIVSTSNFIFPKNNYYWWIRYDIDDWITTNGYGKFRAELYVRGAVLKEADFFINRK